MYNYIIGFSVYTLAMIGIIFVGFAVVKKCSLTRQGSKSRNNFLEIETSLSLAPRKTIHVVRAGNERILIASDVDATTFLTKLEQKGQQNVVYLDEWKEEAEQSEIYSPKMQSLPAKPHIKAIDMIDFAGDDEKPKVFKDLMMRLQK